MKHTSIRELYAYWNARRGARPAPERGDIEPGVIRRALGDTFILAHDPAIGFVFRLAGTRVCALFAREIRGEPFADLWTLASRAAMRDLLTVVADEGVGVVTSASGRTAEGFSCDLELLVLPLHHRGQANLRMIGALAPLATPLWLGASALGGLTLGNRRHLGPAVEATATPLFVARHGPLPLHHGLVVHEGGRR